MYKFKYISKMIYAITYYRINTMKCFLEEYHLSNLQFQRLVNIHTCF